MSISSPALIVLLDLAASWIVTAAAGMASVFLNLVDDMTVVLVLVTVGVKFLWPQKPPLDLGRR
eukprot:2439069-Amphidinium_carterae.1